MATIAMMVGGALVNAFAFSGSNYLFKQLDSKHFDEERKRHDLAMEKYQHDLGEYEKARKNYQDWLSEQYMNKKHAEEVLGNTDMAFKLYAKAHPNTNFDPHNKPQFKDYYKPSNTQKKYELAFVGGGMLLTGYAVSKFL